MSHDAPHAAAHCAEAAVSWIVPDQPVSPPPTEPVLARIERAGPAALDDHELLAILGIAIDAPTLDAAGGLRGLLDDPGDRLRPVVLPHADRVRAHAILEIHARWMEARMERDGGPLTSPSHTRRYIEARLRGYRNEVFAVLYMDVRDRPIAFREEFRGTVDGTSVHPRVVVRHALMYNAATCIACHCHPSGIADPSIADRAITKQLAEALALVQIRLVDHFVVGDGESVSFAVSALPVSDGAAIGLFDGCRVRFGGTLSGCRTAVDASSRCAAPALRSGPSGDPPPSIRRSAFMAVSRAFGHEPIARRGAAMEAGGGCYPLPLPCLPRGSRR